MKRSLAFPPRPQPALAGLVARVTMLLVLGLLYARPVPAQPSGRPLPQDAHQAIPVTVPDGPGDAESAALKLGLEKFCARFIRQDTDTRLLEDRIYSRARRFATAAPARNASETGAVAREYVVTLFLIRPPENKLSLLHELQKLRLLPPVRVAVVIPEEHRVETVPVRVPDPAAETAIARTMEASGIINKDPETVARLRDDTAIRAALSGEISSEQLRELKRRTGGIDFLIVGEAFSVERRASVVTGDVNQPVRCEANVEVKIIDLATGDRFGSDRERGVGFALTGAAAGKKSLQNTGEALAPFIVDSLLLKAINRSVEPTLQLQLAGFTSAGQKTLFLKALKNLAGVVAVRDSEFTGGVLTVSLKMKQEAMEEFSATLETDPGMAPYRITIESDSNGILKGAVKPRK